MHEWLYGNEGYYTKERTIGKEGDFYTAVSTSMFFGGAIAKRLLSTIESGFLSSSCHVVEIGAHKGYLLADMIQFIYTLKPALLSSLKFVIVEPFEANQLMQKTYFEEAFGTAITLKHVKSLDELRCEEAFFVANEIFDAFSCELIKEDPKFIYNILADVGKASNMIQEHTARMEQYLTPEERFTQAVLQDNRPVLEQMKNEGFTPSSRLLESVAANHPTADNLETLHSTFGISLPSMEAEPAMKNMNEPQLGL
jgi:SAM-dependent MidA family methyltransferase